MLLADQKFNIFLFGNLPRVQMSHFQFKTLTTQDMAACEILRQRENKLQSIFTGFIHVWKVLEFEKFFESAGKMEFTP